MLTADDKYIIDADVQVGSFITAELATKGVRAMNAHDALIEAIGELLNRFYPHACDRGAVCAKCEALVAAQTVLREATKES